LEVGAQKPISGGHAPIGVGSIVFDLHLQGDSCFAAIQVRRAVVCGVRRRGYV